MRPRESASRGMDEKQKESRKEATGASVPAVPADSGDDTEVAPTAGHQEQRT